MAKKFTKTEEKNINILAHSGIFYDKETVDGSVRFYCHDYDKFIQMLIPRPSLKNLGECITYIMSGCYDGGIEDGQELMRQKFRKLIGIKDE